MALFAAARRLASALCIWVAVWPASAALAQSPAPERPVRLVVPFAAGGATDILARLVAERLSRTQGQPVVVENRAGANGAIGSEQVAKAPPDGLTLLAVTAGTHAINRSLYRNLPYDPVRDFTPVAMLGSAANVLVVHPSVPAQSVPELVTHLRRNPGKLHFGSAGSGSTLHLSGEMFKAMAGVQMVHIPYKGGGPAQADLLGGHIHMMFDSISAALPHIQSGRVRALAVTGAERSHALPALPTIAEAGVPGYAATAWFGIVGPAGLPAAVTERLNQAINAILAEPDTRAQLTKLGAEPKPMSPAQFGAFVRAEVDKWAKVVEAAGVKAD
jgi:tripartite-type tricarboxylate transporter receptor subunit TctC